MQQKFKYGDIAEFTNKSSTGFTDNNGTWVMVLRYTGDVLARNVGEPCYVVEGLSHACRESELTLIKRGTDNE